MQHAEKQRLDEAEKLKKTLQHNLKRQAVDKERKEHIAKRDM